MCGQFEKSDNSDLVHSRMARRNKTGQFETADHLDLPFRSFEKKKVLIICKPNNQRFNHKNAALVCEKKHWELFFLL